MKSFLSFLSLLAVGLILATLYALIEKGPLSQSLISTGVSPQLEYRSLSLGLVIGFVLSYLTRISWREIPKRTVSWIWAKKEGSVFEFILVLFLVLILFIF